MCLKDGMKEEYISLLHTSIQIIQIDMQGMICTEKRSEEHQHGNPSFQQNTLYMQIKILKTNLREFSFTLVNLSV